MQRERDNAAVVVAINALLLTVIAASAGGTLNQLSLTHTLV